MNAATTVAPEAATQAVEPAKPKYTPLQLEWDALLFSVKRSVRYHTCRREFFERCGFVTNFLTVFIGGGTGVSALVGKSPMLTAILGMITAALSAADLILGYSTKARLYHDLTRDFIKLEKDMIPMRMNPTEEDLIKCQTRRLEIEENEPPKLSVLDAMCHNEVSRALGRDKARVKINPFKQFFRHVHNFDPGECKPISGK